MTLTQESIAEIANLSSRHLSRVENSEQSLSAKLMEKLASAHGLALDDYLLRLIHICGQIEDDATRSRRSGRNGSQSRS